jgi:hypothetical protein
MESELVSGEPNSPFALPRNDYPRPQFRRQAWQCLNGPWEFEIDREKALTADDVCNGSLSREILVPFCPEAPLSGIAESEFMETVWYRRTVTVPGDWKGDRVLLHFQAVDHDATVWVDGEEVARHRGGWTPFSADLGSFETCSREITIVVRAEDPREGSQPRGKQSDRPENYGCLYTRTTGIWQTVWMEPVSSWHLQRPRITPVPERWEFEVELGVSRCLPGGSITASLMAGGEKIASTASRADLSMTHDLRLSIPADARHLWSPESPFLYEIELELADESGRVVDAAWSYAGLRSVGIDGPAVLINGEPVFQRLVLDQGYYLDGVMTAPTEDALVGDIVLAKEAGFNGARLHQKVFEERFLYHCDRLGYLVWGEFADWGAEIGPNGSPEFTPTFFTQWLEVLNRDYSHPSIVGWCPLNEAADTLSDRRSTVDDTVQGMFLATKAADRTRPVLDASGWPHRVAASDVYDCHDYEQDPARFAATMSGLAEGRPPVDLDVGRLLTLVGDEEEIAEAVQELPALPWSLPHAGQPFFCSEFGGIRWQAEADDSEAAWGYGEPPADLEEFHLRFEGLVAVLMGNPDMFGYCYTQLTDVCQERNGLFNFDRSPKLDLGRLKAAQSRLAAIEGGERTAAHAETGREEPV